jgi:hypothetical protein
MSKIMWNCREFAEEFDVDELHDLFTRDDWESPLYEFITNDADWNELEALAEEHSTKWWSDILKESGYKTPYEIWLFEDEGVQWSFDGATELYDDDADAHDAAFEKVEVAVRQAVFESISVSDYGQACCDNNLDPEQLEVYEHWIVSGWLKRKLEERGQVVGEFADFDIWGRCTTGQSIALDRVIQDIACELWSEEFNEGEAK